MNSFDIRSCRLAGKYLYLTLVLLVAGAVQAEPWTFAVMGDNQNSNYSSGVNTEILSQIAADIASNNCRFVLVTGDLISSPPAGYAVWSNAMAPVYQAGIPVYPVRGNHECFGDPTGAVWRSVFPGLPTNGPAGETGFTYSFTFSNVFCVALDQYVNPHRINQAWLDAQLRDNTRPHLIVYGHEPAFRVYHTNCLASYKVSRNMFWDSLQRAGGRVYFCGHDHLYNRAAIIEGNRPPMFQVVAGTGGSRLYAWKGKYDDPRAKLQYSNMTFFGYISVMVEERALTVEWKALLPDGRWKVLDALIIANRKGILSAL